MLFQINPDPQALKELPQLLAAESQRQRVRLKEHLGAEDFDALSAISGFDYVLGLSDFIAGTLFSYPGSCRKYLGAGALERPLSVPFVRDEVHKLILPGLSDAELKKRLRMIRRCLLSLVAWRDLTGRASLEEVLSTTSAIAEIIVLRTMQVVRAALARLFGDALTEEGESLPLLVLGMGKLGGEELNFSSDLDLIFVYPHEGETRGGARSTSFKDFFSQQVRHLANLLADNTADSFCYRIDLRLRPFGDAGALVNSFDALSDYYETQGRTWERYAMVKARLLGGDEAYGHWAGDLNDLLRPFVYRRYLDYGAVESLRKIKLLIESEARRRHLEHNFKLGPGGIREVEFIAQVFQLMRGGRICELRSRSLRQTLKTLGELELLPDRVCEMLDTCYVYLRRLENAVQEFSDRQTQDLPSAEREQQRLLLAMNHTGDYASLLSEIATVMQAVHGEFVAIFASDRNDELADAQYELWDNSADDKEQAALLSEVLPKEGVREALAVEIVRLRSQLARMPVGKVGRETLRNLMPTVINMVCKDQEPATLFVKVGRLIETVALRTTYLQLLNDNRQVLERFVQLLKENALASELITAHPILLDELLVPQYFNSPPSADEFLQMLQERLLRLDPDDLELQMEELRLFKKMMILRVAMSDKSERLPLMKISDCLTWLAEALIRELCLLSWKQCEERYGAPPGCFISDPGMVVIAYGKLGGIELGYKSDLDIVFIRSDDEGQTVGDKAVPCAMFYQRLVQRLLHLSSTRTIGGVLYDLDVRLRPDGDSGLLITSMAAYAEYQRKRAWTLEHQALVRARPIAGSSGLRERFLQLREQVLRTPRDPDKLREDVLKMRAKMRESLDRGKNGLYDLKHSRGGMVDIEFIAQYLVLREAPSHPDMVLWSDNVRIFEECSRLGIISAATCTQLKEAYLAIRGLYHRISLADLPRVVAAADRPAQCADVERIWQEVFALP